MSDDTSLPHGHIDTEIEGSTCWVTFNNPARMNALNTSMWASLPGIIEDAQNNEAVRVVILRGAGGKAFSAGADISEFGSARTGNAAKEYDELNHAAFGAVMRCAKPTIAMIEGYCMGGGLELALVCDFRYAAENARFAITPAKLGLGYSFSDVQRLVAILGAGSARKLLLTGRMHDAIEAVGLGLVDAVMAPTALDESVEALATALSENAPLTLRALKAALIEAGRPAPEQDREYIQQLVDRCHASEDFKEGQLAFSEKRPPRFKGI